MEFEVIVESKKEVLDPEGRAITSSLKNLGFNELSEIKVSKRYLISMSPESGQFFAEEKAHEIAKKHLSNPVAETYRLNKVDKS